MAPCWQTSLSRKSSFWHVLCAAFHEHSLKIMISPKFPRIPFLRALFLNKLTPDIFSSYARQKRNFWLKKEICEKFYSFRNFLETKYETVIADLGLNGFKSKLGWLIIKPFNSEVQLRQFPIPSASRTLLVTWFILVSCINPEHGNDTFSPRNKLISNELRVVICQNTETNFRYKVSFLLLN